MGTKEMNVTLDEYISFLENGVHRDLSNRHLNQIINMHGFQKLHRLPKKEIVEALSCINLLFPFRSTLMENISSSAALTKDEVAADLATLSWQECALQSIETLTWINYNSKLDLESGNYDDELLKRRRIDAVGTVLGAQKRQQWYTN